MTTQRQRTRRTPESGLAEQFAAATEVLTRGGGTTTPAGAGLEEELALAARLRESARQSIPDPAFLDGLRTELRLMARAAEQPAAGGLQWASMSSPIGLLGIAFRDGRVLYCSRLQGERGEQAGEVFERSVAHALGTLPERERALPPKLERGILDHLEGRGRLTAVDLSWLPHFQRRVLEKTAEIPRGEVRPYSWVAREIGSPGAVRAVGTALGHNPIPFIIPCHRVVRSDGTLGEYSGGGPAAKIQVLELEKAPVGELLAAAQRGERFRGSRATHVVCYPSCGAVRGVERDAVASFASLRQAQTSGYEPCARCRPA